MATAKNVMNKTSLYELPKVHDRRGLTVTGGITTDGDSETMSKRRISNVPDETTYLASQLDHGPTLERNSSNEDEAAMMLPGYKSIRAKRLDEPLMVKFERI